MNIFRRTFASISKDPALAARNTSTPLQVRIRRERLRDEQIKSKKPPKQLDGLHKTKPNYQDLLEKRRRIRGVQKVVEPDGKITEKVVGQRIYFPNIIFKMVRNHTPPGTPYNPYEATFRVILSVTKTDVRSYLSSIYGVECTYIRTDVYRPNREKRARGQGDTERAYKRVVVGLVKPFFFPLAVEDMDGKGRWLREADLEDKFQIQLSKKMQREAQVRIMNRVDPRSGWSQKHNNQLSRKHIVKEVWRRKEERERKLREIAENIAKLQDTALLTQPEQTS